MGEGFICFLEDLFPVIHFFTVRRYAQADGKPRFFLKR